MHCSYEDIRSLTTDPPLWFDENAVPRYVAFAPHHLANIYANEAALVVIGCQACRTRFLVAFSRSNMDDVLALGKGRKPITIADAIRDDTLHYGDPPNIGCCAGGPTMNCDDIAVIEYWRRHSFDWKRDTSLEMRLERETT